MKKRGMAYLLTASIIMGSVAFSGGKSARADDTTAIEATDDMTVIETGDDTTETEVSSDEYYAGDDTTETEESGNEYSAETKKVNKSAKSAVVTEAETEAEDDAPISESKQVSKWIQDYTYDIEGNYVILRRYIGDSADVYVRKRAVIDGQTYYTLLEGWDSDNDDVSLGYSIWGAYGGYRSFAVLSISFEEGVMVSDNCRGLFSYCGGIKELDLSGLDMSNVKKADCMFMFCTSLKSLNLGNFTGANLTNMRAMFGYCDSLKSLDLSSFNTRNVTDMALMFYNCERLEDLNVSSFDTGNVRNVEQMFCGCDSLKSLDLSSFDLSGLDGSGNSIFMIDSCYDLEKLYTPRNLGYDVLIPITLYDARGNELKYLPKNSTTTKKLTSVFTGWKNEDGRYRYINSGEYYISEATMLCNGIINNKKNWYAATDGVYDETFSGIAKFEGTSGWGYSKNGVLDTTFSGLAKATNGRWYYVNKGKMDLTFSGKLVQATNGNWYYVNKGKPTKKFTEKIAETTDGKWYYCTDGRPDLKFSGKIAYCTNGNWYYVTKGRIDRSFTGIAEATNGKLYYVEKGVLNKNFTGTVKYNGKTYKIVNGAVK